MKKSIYIAIALLLVLLGHLGYDCRMIEGDFINNDGSTYMHKWNMVLLEDGYVWLDVRMDHANYERTGKLSYTYFLVEDTAQWEKKHKWDHGYSDAMMENAQLLVDTYGLLLELGVFLSGCVLPAAPPLTSTQYDFLLPRPTRPRS